MSGRFLILSAIALLTLPTLLVGALQTDATSSYLTPTSSLSDVVADLTSPHVGTTIAQSSGETSILLDKSGTWIWTGDFNGVHRSTTGASFARSVPPGVAGAFTDGWAIAQDDAGNLYAADTQGQIIFIAKSTDNGVSWTAVNRVAIVAVPFADRPWLAARGNGILALIYNGNGGEGCMLSNDGGLTFTGGVSFGSQTNARNAIFDSAGRLYYGAQSNAMVWNSPCTQVPTPTSVNFGSRGSQIFMPIAVANTGAGVGDIYTALPTNGGNAAMTLRGSHGTNALSVKSINVNDPAVRSNTFGSVAVKPDNSEIAVAWYGSSTPGDPASTSYPSSATWNLYVARVTGFWTATPTVTVSQVDTNVYQGYFCMGGVSCTGGRDMSDYYDVGYGVNGQLHVVWGVHVGGGSQVHYMNLG